MREQKHWSRCRWAVQKRLTRWMQAADLPERLRGVKVGRQNALGAAYDIAKTAYPRRYVTRIAQFHRCGGVRSGVRLQSDWRALGMPSAHGLNMGKTAGLNTQPARPSVRNAPQRSSHQHTTPNFIQVVLQAVTLWSPAFLGAGWTLSSGTSKRCAAGEAFQPFSFARALTLTPVQPPDQPTCWDASVA